MIQVWTQLAVIRQYLSLPVMASIQINRLTDFNILFVNMLGKCFISVFRGGGFWLFFTWTSPLAVIGMYRGWTQSGVNPLLIILLGLFLQKCLRFCSNMNQSWGPLMTLIYLNFCLFVYEVSMYIIYLVYGLKIFVENALPYTFLYHCQLYKSATSL